MIALDLETIPNPNMVSLLPEPTPDARLKDPAKIAASFQKAKAEQVSKMALSPFYGTIWSAALVGDDGTILLKDATGGEAALISEVLSIIKGHNICTYNGISFDLPFLYKRAMQLGVTEVNTPLTAWTKRYQHEPHCDLMQILTDWGKEKYMSLNDAAKLILGKKKVDFDPTKITEAIEAGEQEKILEYNEQDALLTYEIYQKVKMYLF